MFRNSRLPLRGFVVATAFLASAASAQHGQGESHAGSHHPKASAAAMALHDLMEPFWHSRPGAERAAKACASLDEIQQRVKAAATRPAPENAAIRKSAQGLEAACKLKNDTDANQEIDRMHQLFYKIAE
jgi:hypothetical protein